MNMFKEGKEDFLTPGLKAPQLHQEIGISQPRTGNRYG
jgi:hypothetical protein